MSAIISIKRRALVNDHILSCSIKEASRLSGVGRSALYGFISSGDLKAVKCGRRTLIRIVDLRKFIDKLPGMMPAP